MKNIILFPFFLICATVQAQSSALHCNEITINNIKTISQNSPRNDFGVVSNASKVVSGKLNCTDPNGSVKNLGTVNLTVQTTGMNSSGDWIYVIAKNISVYKLNGKTLKTMCGTYSDLKAGLGKYSVESIHILDGIFSRNSENVFLDIEPLNQDYSTYSDSKETVLRMDCKSLAPNILNSVVTY